MADQSLNEAVKQSRSLQQDLFGRLLSDENSILAKADRVFADTRMDLPDNLDRVDKDKVYEAHQKACDTSVDLMGDMVDRAQKKTLGCVRDQMREFDKARSKKHRHGSKAVKAVADDPIDYNGFWGRIIRAAVADATTDFKKRFKHQRGQADDGDDLAERVWSPDPLSRKGLSGRGIIWHTASVVKAEFRQASVHVANATIDDVLLAYNWLDEQEG